MQRPRPLCSSARLSLFALWAVLAAGCATAPAIVPGGPPSAAQQPPASGRGPATPSPSPPAAAGENPAAPGSSPTAAEHGAMTRRSPIAGSAGSTIERRVAALMQRMTLEEKVGQLFMLELRSSRTGRLSRDATPDVLKTITTYHPGGIILFGGNIDTIDQTVALIRGVQTASPIALFVAADEEGGTVSRLASSGKMHAVHMPAASVVGKTDDPKLAEQEGRYIGTELRSLGINMDLAPVADLDTNPENTVIGTRAYSANPSIAARMTKAMVEGLQSVNVSSVIKHFPGHGAATGDSHLGPAVVHRTLAQLRQVEFRPFEAGISAGADGVMVGHLLLPDVLPQQRVPATFSPFVLGTLLRSQLGFKKIIMTDALNMGAIVDYWGPGTAAVDAFEAGADMLLMPENPAAAFRAVLAAVRSDEIPLQRLNGSIRRILTVKVERGIIGDRHEGLNPHSVLGSIKGRKLLAEIDARASSSTP